jgi:hypothetical protein
MEKHKIWNVREEELLIKEANKAKPMAYANFEEDHRQNQEWVYR